MAEERVRRYACFTEAEQAAYAKLNKRQRLYVDYRGKGYGKSQSYQMSGYGGTAPAQAAYILEKQNKTIRDLVAILLKTKRAKSLGDEASDLNKQIDALAKQEEAEKTLEVVEHADGETARRIAFYRDIINGKIKTVRRTTIRSASGAIKSVKEEVTNDVALRIQARKELDKVLGLNMFVPDVDRLQIGGITVNIVDASKKEELADERNAVAIDMENVEVLDGEKKIVVDGDVE